MPREGLALQVHHSIGRDGTQGLCSNCLEIPGASEESRGRCMVWEVLCVGVCVEF